MKSKFSLLLSLISLLIYPQSDLRVISSNENSIVIEYKPFFYDSSNVKSEGIEYLNLKLENGIIPEEITEGLPVIPERVIVLGVPSELGNTLQVLNSNFKEINGELLPKPVFIKDENGFLIHDYKKSAEYYNYYPPDEIVTFGEFGILRGIPAQDIRVLPIKFFPQEKKIRIYTSIIFQLNYSKDRKISQKPADDLLTRTLLNFNTARFWQKDSKKSLEKAVISSVLTTGKWVRFETQQEGIYRINYADLPSYGIEPSTVDPRTIKIYNNGGKVLPENINLPYPDDLLENAIMVVGEADGKFDEGDYILFYGRGIHFWEYDSTSGNIKRYFHPYSKENFYWITSGGSPGKRMSEVFSLNDPNPYVQTSTIAFASWEEDKINFGKTGWEYMGDNFTLNSSSRVYMNRLDGRIPGSNINYRIHFINNSETTITLRVNESGANLLTQNINGTGSNGFENYLVGRKLLTSFNYSGDITEGNRSVLTFTFDPRGDLSAVGYLDFFEITYLKTLTASNDQLLFFSEDTSSVIQYNLTGFSSSNTRVFDISDFSDVKFINGTASGGDYTFQVNGINGKRSKYFAIGNNFLSPSNPVEMPNQNLHGETAVGAEFIIITHRDFKEQADRLKAHRESGSQINLSTIVVEIDKIINEFSGGIFDIGGVRNFIQYAYNNWAIKPKYVLLFGDGTYDFKNLEGANNNFIPTRQISFITETRRGDLLEILNSGPNDDFYVYVDGNDDRVDLAIGRLTINSPDEAKNIVDKIIDYDNSDVSDGWNNTITLVADDGITTEGDEGQLHTGAQENLTRDIIPSYFNVKKLYLPAYPTVLTGIGRTKPGVARAIINAINEGTLIVGYVGHGNPEVWAHERVFERSTTIPQLNNDKYFFLTAATCDFGYYDLTTVQSSTEVMLLKEKSGLIGAFAASRPVYANQNETINRRFYSELLLSIRDTLNLSHPIGIAYMNTKQIHRTTNDKQFLLFGDPTLRLKIPQYSASIDSLNGKSTQLQDTLKALSNAHLSGSILKPDNTVWEDFIGEGLITVFDSERRTIITEPGRNSIQSYTIDYPGGRIFNGKVSINNGKFSSQFVVPKDISYENKNGKIVIYFYNDEVNGVGHLTNVIVGGTDSSAVNDGKGPEIEISFSEQKNNLAYLTSPASSLIVRLTDETGINTTGTGIGHRLEGILNGQENNPIDFTTYFTGDTDAGGKSGEINYPLSDFEPGKYRLLIKAWDVFNNHSSKEISFEVAEENDLVINDVFNYPNPFSSSTTFSFQKNLPAEVDVNVKIYTVAGRLIKEIEQKNLSDNFIRIDWDGRDGDGNILANGTYLYKMIIKTIDGNFEKDVLGKLAVIR